MIKTSIKIFFSLLLFFSCSTLEDISDPALPYGSIKWLINVNDENHGLLQENEQPATIGILTAEDSNPYDEVIFSLDRQTVDGRDVNFFTVTSESG